MINVHGRAVCLNAGGRRRAASSFYLPLDRVVRALKILQQEGHTKNITRGTMQTVFRHRGFDEVNRLGLHSTIEEEVRRTFPESTGMLVVDHVLLEGPAAGKLEPGDVLIKVNGEFCCGFFSLRRRWITVLGVKFRWRFPVARRWAKRTARQKNLQISSPSL